MVPTSLNTGQENDARLIDYGAATSYLEEDGKHKSSKLTCNFTGNILTASYNRLNWKVSSRRDDLIALGYLMLAMSGNCQFKKVYYNPELSSD